MTLLARPKGQTGWERNRLLRRTVILHSDAGQETVKPLLRKSNRHRNVHRLKRAAQHVSDKAIKTAPRGQRLFQIGRRFLSVVAQFDTVGRKGHPLLLVRNFYRRGKGRSQGVERVLARHPVNWHASHGHPVRQGTASRAVAHVLPREKERRNSNYNDDPDDNPTFKPQGVPSIILVW